MYKVILFLIIFIFVSSVQVEGEDRYLRLEESNSNFLTLKLEIPSFEFDEVQKDGQSWQTLSFRSCEYTYFEGKPKLPIKTCLIGIPPNSEPNLQLIDSDYSLQKIGRIVPVRNISIGDDDMHSLPRSNTHHAPRTTHHSPSKLVELSFTGYIRNSRVVQVRFNPVIYNQVTKTAKLYHKLRIKITFQRTTGAPSINTANSPPESKTFSKILERNILNYDVSKSWQNKQSRVMASPSSEKPSSEPGCRIYVDEDGIYSIGYEQLIQALPEELDKIDPRTFKMYNKDIPVPIFVRGENDRSFDPNDEIIFYGEHNRGKNAYYNRYSVENVYWLYWTGKVGIRMIEHKFKHEIDTKDVLIYRKYKHLVHMEENNLFVPLPQARDNIDENYRYEREGYIVKRGQWYYLPPLPFDNWYWDRIGAPNLKSYSFELPDVAETSLNASIKVALRGKTYNPARPDHHTQIWLNGEKMLEDAKWDGQQLHIFESEDVSQDYLVNGTNKITIICPGDTQAKEIDQILLDWIELKYWRDYSAVDDFLKFSIPELDKYQIKNEIRISISGFSKNNIEIYGTNGTKYTGVAVVEDEQNPGKYEVIFRLDGLDTDENVQYIALDTDSFKKPKAIIRDEPSNLRSPENGADYIIITHDYFTSGVKELADWRASQGLRVATVTIQNIYDEFSYGILNPYAIRDFLVYAYENWRSPAPSFVTLIGDSKNIKPTPSENLISVEAYIPTTLVRSNKSGATASDYHYSLLHGEDTLPDIVISRLPVNNMIELSDVIEKVIAYEKNRVLGPWRKKFLFLAGTGKYNFSGQSENIIKRNVSQSFENIRIYTDNPESPYYGNTIDVVNEISSGNLVVNFIGHGGGGIWSDNRMMGLEDIELLENSERLPFVLSMTCYTGDFNNKHRLCLGEKMIISEKKGAIAFWGNTGLGWVTQDYLLNQEAFEKMFATSEPTTIGGIVTDAKISFISKYPYNIDLAHMFTLFGDSAQVFELPEKGISVQSPGAIESNEIVKTTGMVNKSGLDIGNLEVVISTPSSQESVSQLSRLTTSLNSRQFNLQVQTPQTSESGTGIISVYAWNENTDAIGSTTYSVGMPHVSNFYIEPPIKQNSQSYLYAEAYSTGKLSLNAYWTYNISESWTKVPMDKVKENLYRTDSPLPSDSPYRVYYYIELTDSRGRTVKTERQYYLAVTYPDFTFTEEGVKWIVDKSSVLQVKVQNKGEQTANNIVVRFYDVLSQDTNKKEKIANDQTISILNPNESKTVQVPWEPENNQHTISVEIDPNKEIREQNESNNFISEQFSGNRFYLTPQKDSNGVIQSIDKNLTLSLASGKISQSSILAIDKMELIPLNQPELKYVPLPGSAEGSVYVLDLISDSNETSEQLYANLSIIPDLNQISDIDSLKIYWYDEDTSKWMLAGKNSVQNNKITTVISHDGLYSLIESSDRTPPKITITMEQGLIPGSFVSENPLVSVALRDINGVDVREDTTCEISDRLILLKDQTVVDRSEYSVSASPTQSGLMILTYSPNLSPGQHTLTVQAFDSSGNLGEDNVEFKVAGELEIDKLANYPNPMIPGNNRIRGEGTIFAYVLTKEADSVSLRIYTSTGRLVNSFQTLDAFADYNEFFWDGLDGDGEELSNGVYFYKMKVERDDRVVEKVGKLAILR